MRSMDCSKWRAWWASAWPAGVAWAPFAPRSSSGTRSCASMSEMRLLTADGTMLSRAAARAMLPSSSVARNRRMETGSRSRMAGCPSHAGGVRGEAALVLVDLQRASQRRERALRAIRAIAHLATGTDQRGGVGIEQVEALRIDQAIRVARIAAQGHREDALGRAVAAAPMFHRARDPQVG